MVDWSGNLEAVHMDGRVMPLDRRDTTQRDEASWFVQLGGRPHVASDASGSIRYTGWTVRNVVEQPAWRTSAEQLDRMDALVKRLAERAGMWSVAYEEWQEAKAILAAREPVDPRFDKVQAAIMASDSGPLSTATAARLARDVLAALDA